MGGSSPLRDPFQQQVRCILVTNEGTTSTEAVSTQQTSTHMDHLEAHEDHAQWLKDLERWQREYTEAIQSFAGDLPPSGSVARGTGSRPA